MHAIGSSPGLISRTLTDGICPLWSNYLVPRLLDRGRGRPFAGMVEWRAKASTRLLPPFRFRNLFSHLKKAYHPSLVIEATVLHLIVFSPFRLRHVARTAGGESRRSASMRVYASVLRESAAFDWLWLSSPPTNEPYILMVELAEFRDLLGNRSSSTRNVAKAPHRITTACFQDQIQVG